MSDIEVCSLSGGVHRWGSGAFYCYCGKYGENGVECLRRDVENLQKSIETLDKHSHLLSEELIIKLQRVCSRIIAECSKPKGSGAV